MTLTHGDKVIQPYLFVTNVTKYARVFLSLASAFQADDMFASEISATN
jgi:hypothetical protein